MRQYTIPAPTYWILRDAPLPDGYTPPQVSESLTNVEEFKALLKKVEEGTASVEEIRNFRFGYFRKMPETLEDFQKVFEVEDKQARILFLAYNAFLDIFRQPRVVRNISDVQSLYSYLAYASQESMHVILLNLRQEVIDMVEVARGSVGGAPISMGSVFEPILNQKSPAFVVVHNHPSGTCTPSKDDYEFTESLIQASKLMNRVLLDHVVIAADGVASCLPDDYLPDIAVAAGA